MPFELFEASAAVIAALFGGIGIKVLEKLMNKKSEAFNEAAKLREELRNELVVVRKEADDWQTDADEWRTKFYTKVEETIHLNQQIETLRLEIHRLKMKSDAHLSGSI